jgi:uncharacterized membrane protein YdjX (TVP38/TMEM64 family)
MEYLLGWMLVWGVAIIGGVIIFLVLHYLNRDKN